MRANLKAGDPSGSSKLMPRKRTKASGDCGGEASLMGISVARTQSRSFNQRKEDRQRDLIDAAAILFRKRRHDVGVVNVSAGGTMIEAELDTPEIGEPIDVILGGCDRIRGAIRWIKGNRIGVEFLEETTILASLKVQRQIHAPAPGMPAATSQRSQEKLLHARSTRHGVTITGTLYWSYEAFSVRLRNISAKGAMVEGCNLEPESRVRLNLEAAGTLQGEVRWCRNGLVGIRFDERFDLTRLAAKKPACERSGDPIHRPDLRPLPGPHEEPNEARRTGLSRYWFLGADRRRT